MKSILAHLGIVALVLLWLHVKPQPAANAPQPSPPRITTTTATPVLATCDGPKRIDPYEIEVWINKHPDCTLQPIISLLGIQHEDMSNAKNKNFKAEILLPDFGTAFSPWVLEIFWPGGSSGHFFFFDHNEKSGAVNKWRLIEEIETNDYLFDYRVVIGEKQSWFVIRDRWVRGSGSWLHGETWYEVTKSSVNQVLAFPVSGCELGTQNLKDREFNGVAVSHEIINGHTTIKVKFKVKYIFPYEYPRAVLSKSQEAVFIRNNTSGEFKLDEAQSNVTDKELDDVYSIESLDDAKFLKYNFAELMKSASRGSKNELKKYLRGLPKSQQTKLLLAKLN